MKISIILFALLLVCINAPAQNWVNPNHHQVSGYTRSDGTKVQTYNRTNRNSTNRDNYSTQGNTNPFTGEPGTVLPDHNLLFPSYPTTSQPSTLIPLSYSTPRSTVIPLNRANSNLDWPNSTNNGYSTTNRYDLTPGERVIEYKNGRDKFEVASSRIIKYKKGYSYYSFDVYNQQIKESIGTGGALVLNGPYRFYDEAGRLRISENYKNGLKHGKSIHYDEFGNLINDEEYTEGVLTYQKLTSDDGITYEIFGAFKHSGSRLLLYNEDGLFKKIDFLDNSRDRRTEYAPGTNNVTSQYSTLNDQKDGPFNEFYADGRTLKEASNYKNGQLEGELRQYYPNGTLQAKYNYKSGLYQGTFEHYWENGKVYLKGNALKGKLYGPALSYDQEGQLKSRLNYQNDLLEGVFQIYQDGKLKTNVAYHEGQKDGRWDYFYVSPTRYFLAEWQTFTKGVVDGPFQEIHGDSVLVGRYAIGLLDGRFRAYQPFDLFLQGIPPEKLTEEELLCTGEYKAGKKTGYWQIYSPTRTLQQEGVYWNDQKQGEWRYYLDKYVDRTGQHIPAGQLYLTENYLDGEKNGRSIRSGQLSVNPVMCDTTIGTVNPLDTCYVLVYKKVRETAFYKNNVLHGPIEIYDESGTLTHKGEYRLGKKNGPWIELYPNAIDTSQLIRYEITYDNDKFDGPFQSFDAVTSAKLNEGAFSNNKKSGIWKEYFPGNNKLSTVSDYTEGKQNFLKTFDINGHLTFSAKYLDGNITSFEKYGTSSNQVSNKVDNIHFQDGIYNFDYFIYGDSIRQMHLVYASSDLEPDQDPSDLYTAFATGHTYKEGPYLIKNKEGQLLQAGNFVADKHSGLWKTYYYQQNILLEINYEADEKIYESYSSINPSRPFSGKFILPISPEGGYLKIKAKKGLRDGFTKKYDAYGKLIKKTKYKNGQKNKESIL